MNFQHLKHFLAVAEELHFGHAAERLCMAQPPLSQSIRRLETSLGCQLFTRARRQVELTAAGEALLQSVPEILNLVEFARRSALSADEVGLKKLTIGFTPNALTELVPKALREIKHLMPNVEVMLMEGTSIEHLARLPTGEVDIAFIPEPRERTRGLDVRVIDRHTNVVAVREGSDLAAMAELRIEDLRDVPLIMVPEGLRRSYCATMLEAFEAAGIKPQISQEALFDHTRLRMVAAGLGVAFVSQMAVPNGFPGVALKPMRDVPIEVAFCMVRKSAASPAVRRLFDAVYNVLRQPVESSDAWSPEVAVGYGGTTPISTAGLPAAAGQQDRPHMV